MCLCICRPPFGSVLRDLLLGCGHGSRAVRQSRNRVGLLGGWLMVRHVIELVNFSMMRTEDLLEGGRHILQEVKAVGDLRGLWSPLPHARGRGFGSVPGANRAVGVGLEPRGHSCSRPICKHVERTTPVQDRQ